MSKLSVAFAFVVICVQICNCQLPENELARTVELIGAIDLAKEAATSCRSLINHANNIGNLSSQERQALLFLIPKLIEECYFFLEKILALKWNQFGFGKSSVIGGKLAQLASGPGPTSTSNAPSQSRLLPDWSTQILNTNELRQTDFRERILKEASAKGADYCTFVTTGVLGEIIDFVQKYLFTNQISSHGPGGFLESSPVIRTQLNHFIPPQSPLASFKSLKRFKSNSRLQNLLRVGERCKQLKAESHLEPNPYSRLAQQRPKPSDYLSPEYALDALGPNPTCEKVNIFLLIRLHSIKDDQVIARLSEISTNLLSACLENLSQVYLNVFQEPLTIEQKRFSKELIDFLGNKFVPKSSSNIIDRINPRSLINNNIEHDLFFHAKVQEKLNNHEFNLIQVYIDGEPICNTIKTYDFYNVVNIDLTSSMELLHILMSIDDLEVDLSQFRNNQQLQFILLWYTCKDLSLYKLIVRDRHSLVSLADLNNPRLTSF